MPFGGLKEHIEPETTSWESWLGNSGDSESDLLDFNGWSSLNDRYKFIMYDPYIGRFLAVDELWSAHPGWNPYHYAMNNPVE